MSKRPTCESASGSRPSKQPRDASSEWWDNIAPSEFREEFRMSPFTFNSICREIPLFSITRKPATHKDHRRNLAACIWRLASGGKLDAVNKGFGLSREQLSHSLRIFVDFFEKKYLEWPDETEMAETKAGFQRISGIENVVGAMNTTRITIVAPSQSKYPTTDLFRDEKLSNRRSSRKSFSTAVQVVVDHKGMFKHIFIGAPGSYPDYRVYDISPLREKVGSLQEGAWIVGNSKYPLMNGILVPYPNYKFLSPTQQKFDDQLFEIESVAIEACLRLKSRWLILRAEDLTLESIEAIVKGCCILHNICEAIDPIDMEWRLMFEDNSCIPEKPVLSATASRERDALVESFAQKLEISSS